MVLDLSPAPLAPPVFFVSHARGGSGKPSGRKPPFADDLYLRAFFRDLSRHVQQLVGARLGAAPGFIDLSIPAGQRWEKRIIAMLNSAAVLVALLSADYVESHWCGKEWDAFSRRRPTHKEGEPVDAQTTILPVVWSPLAPARVPRVVRDVQQFAPDFQDDQLQRLYLRNGIYGLRAAESAQYGAVVWQLAQLVADLYHTFDVPVGRPVTVAELRDVFKETAP